MNSPGCDSIRWRVNCISAAFLPRYVSSTWMENRLYHCHDRCWLCHARVVCVVPDLCGTSSILKAQILDRSNRSGGVSNRLHLPDVLLLLEQLLYVFLASCQQFVGLGGWLCQQYLPGCLWRSFIHHRLLYPPHWTFPMAILHSRATIHLRSWFND